MLDVLIIGAGITGIAAGCLLRRRGLENFIILEAAAVPGGLCRTQIADGHIVDVGGGHFLCSKQPEVYEFIFSHMPEDEFNCFDRVSKIHLQGRLIDYPMEINIWQLPVAEQIEYLLSMMQTFIASPEGQASNFEQWIRQNLGNRVAENYMLPYNRKLWGIEPRQMDVDWLGKIPQLNTREILRACLDRQADREKMPSHACFYYPKQGGFQEIFAALLAKVQEKVVLGEAVKTLAFQQGFWSVNGTYQARAVINTAPWPDLYQGLGAPSEMENCFAKLQSNAVVVSLWEKEYDHDWHWCYYPDDNFEYHRDFYIRNFAPHSRPDGLYTETNRERWPGKRAVWRQGAKPVFEHINRRAYPIPVLGHAKARKTILDFYGEHRLYGAGRWGRWEYMNADVCILDAMRLVDRILAG